MDETKSHSNGIGFLRSEVRQRSHVVATYDGVTMKIYVNGTLENSNTVNQGNLTSNSDPASIGARQLTSVSPYNLTVTGSLAAISLYSEALTSVYITQLCEASEDKFNGLVCH